MKTKTNINGAQLLSCEEKPMSMRARYAEWHGGLEFWVIQVLGYWFFASLIYLAIVKLYN